MAGILAHARGMIAVLAPLVNCYKRLVPGLRGADLPDLGPDEPLGADPGAEGLAGQVDRGRPALEVRCPDPSSNTYLAFAAMIAAGLDGVEKGLELGEPVEESPLRDGRGHGSRRRAIRELPGTLGEALDELEKDDVIRDALGDHVFSHFVEAKRAEWDEYRTQVSRLGGRPLPGAVLGGRPSPTHHADHEAQIDRESR